MFDSATAIRILGYPVRSRKAERKDTTVETVGTNVGVDIRAKRPSNQGWRSAEWWQQHNYEYELYKEIFRGR
jgi:hypothetical protein